MGEEKQKDGSRESEAEEDKKVDAEVVQTARRVGLKVKGKKQMG